MLRFKQIAMSFVITLVMYMTYIIPTTVLTTFSMTAEAAECTLYETIHPSFPLTGAHLSTGKCSTCASCHAGGRFVGTPKTCVACHNGGPTSATVGRSTAHIPIGPADCGSCHNTTSFQTNVKMDHTAVAALRCDSCHNSSFTSYGAEGKPRDHIPTTLDCGMCHRAGGDWDADFESVHRGVTNNCVRCHNGTNATGKSDAPGGHPQTSDQCETCHSFANEFKCTQIINDPKIRKMLQDPFFASNYRRYGN